MIANLIDYSIPKSYNLGGMIAQQQDIVSQDIANQMRQQQMAQQAQAFPVEQQRAQLANINQAQANQLQGMNVEKLVKSKQIYQDSLDEKGNLDPNKYKQELYKAGYGDLAQAYDKTVADIADKTATANMQTMHAKSEGISNQIMQAQSQANKIYLLTNSFFTARPELNSENISKLDPKKQPLTQGQLDAYNYLYNGVQKLGLQDNIDNPDQFRANPQLAIQKLDALTKESDIRQKDAQLAMENHRNQMLNIFRGSELTLKKEALENKENKQVEGKPLTSRSPAVIDSRALDNYSDILDLAKGKITATVAGMMMKKAEASGDPTLLQNVQNRLTFFTANPNGVWSDAQKQDFTGAIKTLADAKLNKVQSYKESISDKQWEPIQYTVDRYQKLANSKERKSLADIFK